jgi:hypothetical protein
MDAFTVSLILVALGSASLILRDPRALLAGGALQWLGLALAGATTPTGALQFSRGAGVEIVTALICLSVLAVTLRSGLARGAKPGTSRTLRDYGLLALAIVLIGGAGLVLASSVPLTGVASLDIIFYWSALSGAAALALQGTRDAVKLTLGLFSLLNCAVLLVQTLSLTPPGVGLLAIMALSRLGLALAVAYGWNWLLDSFGTLSLDPLFAAPAQATSLELVVSEAPPVEELTALVPVGAEPLDAEPDEEQPE